MISPWLGCEYSKALRCAREAGEGPWRIVVTYPSAAGCGQGNLRVVAVRVKNDKQEWVLAYPGYQRWRKPAAEKSKRVSQQGIKAPNHNLA